MTKQKIIRAKKAAGSHPQQTDAESAGSTSVS